MDFSFEIVPPRAFINHHEVSWKFIYFGELSEIVQSEFLVRNSISAFTFITRHEVSWKLYIFWGIMRNR